MTEDVLLLFCKYPMKGFVKTRIATSMGDNFALELYKSFIIDIINMTTHISADKIIVIDGSDDKSLNEMNFNTSYPVIKQQGFNIGSRMYNAFQYVFHLGYKRAVLIGSDSPDLPYKIISNAMNSLQSNEITLGESTDGGYYLIGFQNNSCEEIFLKNIEWSTHNVFNQTMKKIRSSKKNVSLQPLWRDIDDQNDLKLFYHENIKNGEISSHTMKFIEKSLKENKIKI